jgi:hypothetical protein
MNFWQQMCLNTVLAFLASTFKSDKAKAQARAVALQIIDAIKLNFAGDVEFKAEAKRRGVTIAD